MLTVSYFLQAYHLQAHQQPQSPIPKKSNASVLYSVSGLQSEELVSFKGHGCVEGQAS